MENKKIIWWKDKKFLVGLILIILNLVLGFYGKVLIGKAIVTKFVRPVEAITGISIYALSFVTLFLGVFLVGWETIRMIRQKIHHHVKNSVKKTYHHAKSLPLKGYHYTRRLHRKGVERIKKSFAKND